MIEQEFFILTISHIVVIILQKNPLYFRKAGLCSP